LNVSRFWMGQLTCRVLSRRLYAMATEV
jgi:hypothetical protein